MGFEFFFLKKNSRCLDVDSLIYIGDGRFHLESAMISNPHVPAFRNFFSSIFTFFNTLFKGYDPYDKKLTSEGFEHEKMKEIRFNGKGQILVFCLIAFLFSH